MKRILYVHEMAEISGIETAIYDIIRHLDPARLVPIVACPPGPFVERLQALGTPHIPFTFRMLALKAHIPGTPYRFINPIALLRKVYEGFQLARLIRRHHIDILHTNSLSSHLAGLVASKLTGVPLIWHIHIYMMRLLFQLPLPERIIFVSHAVFNDAFPDGSPPQACVIYNAQSLIRLDTPSRPYRDIRSEFGISPEQPLVGMIGTVDPIKGIDEVLKAWSLVLETVPDARFLHVGKVSTPRGVTFMNDLNQMIGELNIGRSVQFAGFRSDIEDILHALDIYISFTKNDTLSISVLEAMAAERPVIGANSGGMPELIVPGKTGVLIDSGDVEGLANTIIKLIQEPATRQFMGQAGRRRAFEHFALETYVRQMDSLYEGL